MTIYYDGDEHVAAQEKAWIEQALAAVLAREGLDQPGEVSISFVSDEAIRELNRDYRAQDKVTDVLSFPQYDSLDEARQADYLFLGDIVINLDQLARQAAEYGHSLDREVSYLSVHSLYHLLGFDHQTDQAKAEMRAKEDYIMHLLEDL